LDDAVEGLIGGWLEEREAGESFPTFTRRLSDEDLGRLAGVEPARRREREEMAA
jgi:hypothetical protein